YVAASTQRRRLGLSLHAAPEDELVHDGLEPLAVPGQRVADGRRTRVQYAPVEEARFDEVVQSRGKGRGGYATECDEELVEALGPLDRRVEDRDRPAALEEARRLADLLGNRLTRSAAHGRPRRCPASERARAPARAP